MNPTDTKLQPSIQKDDVIAVSHIYGTKNYDQFKFMKGNRPVDQRHVAALARKMKEEGNLMDKFPVQVNEHMFVIDGQHRILAAAKNKDTVYYQIVENATLPTVITLNTDNKNWTWLDFAYSWAAQNNHHYQEFIELQKEYNDNFYVLLRYCSGLVARTVESSDSTAKRFRNGTFEMKDIALTRKLLRQYHEIVEEAGFNDRQFAHALYSFMRTPGYEHEKLVQNVRAYGDRLRNCFTIGDFLLALEDIYKA